MFFKLLALILRKIVFPFFFLKKGLHEYVPLPHLDFAYGYTLPYNTDVYR